MDQAVLNGGLSEKRCFVDGMAVLFKGLCRIFSEGVR
jgi:hypothetical protein